jgi:hypothetical protein
MFARRHRFAIALAVATSALGVATATAYAEGPVFLVNGVKLEAGKTVNADGKGTLFFTATPFGVKVEITCTELKEKMLLKGGEPGTDEDKLEFSKCTVGKPANCTVKEPILLESNTTLQFLIGGLGAWKVANEAEWNAAAKKGFGDKFVGKGAEETVTEVTLEGANCALKGKPFKVSGNYTGIVNNGIEFISELDNLTCGGKPSVATGLLEFVGTEGQKLAVAA